MSAIKEYFDTDFSRFLQIIKDVEVPVGETSVLVSTRLCLDHEAYLRFAAVFISELDSVFHITSSLVHDVRPFIDLRGQQIYFPQGKSNYRLFAVWQGAEIWLHEPPEPEVYASSLPFSGRVFIYTDDEVEIEVRQSLRQLAATNRIWLRFRGPAYAEQRIIDKPPKAFLIHDSRDDEIARKIANNLRGRKCPVWFADYSMEVGDGLRESIEKGLKECHRCILVLTPNFLNKGGWPKREYETAYTRELVEDTKLFLPVWSGVTRDDVYAYSPILADRDALKWDELGEEEVSQALFNTLYFT